MLATLAANICGGLFKTNACRGALQNQTKNNFAVLHAECTEGRKSTQQNKIGKAHYGLSDLAQMSGSHAAAIETPHQFFADHDREGRHVAQHGLICGLEGARARCWWKTRLLYLLAVGSLLIISICRDVIFIIAGGRG